MCETSFQGVREVGLKLLGNFLSLRNKCLLLIKFSIIPHLLSLNKLQNVGVSKSEQRFFRGAGVKNGWEPLAYSFSSSLALRCALRESGCRIGYKPTKMS